MNKVSGGTCNSVVAHPSFVVWYYPLLRSSEHLRGPLADDADTAGAPESRGDTTRGQQWPGLRLILAGPYRVCVCRGQGSGCDTAEEFAVDAGNFTAKGAVAAVAESLVAGNAFAFRLAIIGPHST